MRRPPPRSRLDVAGLIFVIALLLGAGRTAAAPSGNAPGASHYLLDHQGHLFAWVPDRPELKPIPLNWPAVNDLAPIGGGQRLLILADDPAEGDDRRGRARGLAVVLDPTTSPPVAIHQIHFQGRGLRAAVADPHRAYLLAYRAGHAEQAGEERELGNSPRAWVHAVDLDTGVVVDSLGLMQPATSIAVAPGGKRLFVAMQDRILSCSTGPLATSWYYRSPGLNLGLSFRPGTDILHVVRGREVALFDPRVIAAWSEQERYLRADDATSLVTLAHDAAALLFSEDGSMAVAYGGTNRLTFLDARRLAVLDGSPPPAALDEAALVRPILFPSASSDLVVAVFPGARIEPIAHPALAAAAPPPATPSPSPAAPAAEPAPSMQPAASPERAPAAGAAPTPLPPPPPADQPTAPFEPPSRPAGTPEREVGEPMLRGRVTGERQRVIAILIYGPNSIIREQARVAPGTDGAWSAPLPPPGTYRVVPIGEGSRLLRTRPNFHTVVVKPGEARGGIDFVVER